MRRENISASRITNANKSPLCCKTTFLWSVFRRVPLIFRRNTAKNSCSSRVLGSLEFGEMSVNAWRPKEASRRGDLLPTHLNFYCLLEQQNTDRGNMIRFARYLL
ncbi:hypothetical protein AVEN_25381-1 [Araneus ventricosus]|uniref:Uncharacterized protein n=1 Tax=Araneus ventricosus TaxID=182803 RepID=A0A4Y2EHN7_ARAVE|nr:hypothetical protein AVEN_25381-1 [Araneus ventricosus]